MSTEQGLQFILKGRSPMMLLLPVVIHLLQKAMPRASKGIRTVGDLGHNPVGVDLFPLLNPGLLASSQPWALSQNPFGIRRFGNGPAKFSETVAEIFFSASLSRKLRTGQKFRGGGESSGNFRMTKQSE
jgi:hypothetical protein